LNNKEEVMNRFKIADTITVAVLLFVTFQLTQTVVTAEWQEAVTATVLQEFDPVALIKGREIKGDGKLSVNRGKFKYLFANEENKSSFERDPKRYEIQLGGECPVVAGAQGDPNLFLVYKEKIYIFATEECVAQFKADPKSYVN
jgi:YHS domain-containing protein